MNDLTDAELLARFAQSESEEAFAALVGRHIHLVHSVTLRHTANPHHAQEITQAVFIILARKARSLGPNIVLSGWLYHTARLTAANFQRAELRRLRREQEAFMQSTLDEPAHDGAWDELAPVLDEAMAQLGRADRDAVVLRYFEKKSLAEVGVALGLEERAAQKRVTRALEKLRLLFGKRGVRASCALIAGAISTHSVQAAPTALTGTITAAALAGSTVAVSTLTLVKETILHMTWIKAKTALAIGAGAAVLAGAAVVHHAHLDHAQTIPAKRQADAATAVAGAGTGTGRLGEGAGGGSMSGAGGMGGMGGGTAAPGYANRSDKQRAEAAAIGSGSGAAGGSGGMIGGGSGFGTTTPAAAAQKLADEAKAGR